MANDAYRFSALSWDGRIINLADFEQQVVLIVNTASRCGFTPQYRALENLYQRFKAQGFSVLAFPCNQFGAQEPNTDAEIQAFCNHTYGVTFPLFAKIDVNGKNTHPLFHYLKSQASGFLGSKAIKWNFTKFLIQRDGVVFKRYAPQTSPQKLTGVIERLLRQSDS